MKKNQNVEGNTNLANESDHMARNVTLRETGTGISEEVLPFSLEGSIVRVITETGVVFGDQILG